MTIEYGSAECCPVVRVAIAATRRMASGEYKLKLARVWLAEQSNRAFFKAASTTIINNLAHDFVRILLAMHLHKDLADHSLLILCIRITSTVFAHYKPVVIGFLSKTVIEIETIAGGKWR